MPRLRLAAALAGAVAVALGAGGLTFSAGPTSADSIGTPLPAGWELCVLQGLSSPVTQANVSDLDAWQAAEGGSTNNSAAYNPFNTRRTTDVNNNPVPETMSSNGFPAFSSWVAGCAATVATLFQPNMWPITAALRAGDVSPSGAFLATVDQSQWCAPSADGTPCYANQIVGASGDLASTLITDSAALSVYGNVKSDLHDYQQDIATVSTDHGVLTARNDELVAAQLDLTAAQRKLAAAQRALSQFAVDTYVNGGTYASTSFMNLAGPKPFGPEDTDGVVADQYENIVASELDAHEQTAASTERADQSHRASAIKSVALAVNTLASDTAAESRALAKLVEDVSTLQTAGACTTAVITATPATPASGVSGTSQPANASGNATATTTTTVPAAAAPTTTTTTTTVPPTTTTTSTVPTTVPAIKVPVTVPSTVPPTTVPPSTVPPTSTTTTTTTTVAGSGGPKPATAAPQTANPAGLQVLQGCITALAPPPGQ